VNVDLGIWGKMTRVVICLLVVAVLLGIGVLYLPLIQQNERMRKEVLRLKAQTAKEEEINRQLKAAVESLRNDPKAIERYAREKFGYAKPGETVIRFEPALTQRATTQ
jgi:cell division protein FtsB